MTSFLPSNGIRTTFEPVFKQKLLTLPLWKGEGNMKFFVIIGILIVLIGCQKVVEDHQTNNGGGTETKFDFDHEINFVQETLKIENRFARAIVFALSDAGMSGSIIRIEVFYSEMPTDTIKEAFRFEMPIEELEEAIASAVRPFAFLEIKSEDGRTYRVYTGRNTVNAVLDAETEEILWWVR